MKIVLVKRMGTRIVNGSEWPIETVLERATPKNEPSCTRAYWLVTVGLCNGTAEAAYRYKTRAEALEHPDFRSAP